MSSPFSHIPTEEVKTDLALATDVRDKELLRIKRNEQIGAPTSYMWKEVQGLNAHIELLQSIISEREA